MIGKTLAIIRSQRNSTKRDNVFYKAATPDIDRFVALKIPPPEEGR